MELKLKFIISLVVLVGLVPVSYWLLPANRVGAAPGIAKFEQQINFVNGEYSTSNLTDSPTDNSLGLIHFDSSEYDGDTVYFEALIKCDTCSGGNGQVSAGLYNDSGSSITNVVTDSDNYTLVRSGSLVPAADDYTVRFKVDATSGTAYLKAARLIIIQSNSSGISDTQTQIEVGHFENTTATSATQISAPKYYVYADDKFSGTKNAYFEATLKTEGSSTTASYYFNAYDSGGEEWSNNPSYLTDNNTANYASTDTDSQVELLTGNTSAGGDLGTITKVEVRAYAYQTLSTAGSLTLRPVFDGSADGSNHDITPPQDAGDWSAYQDITSDPNAPSTWTWSDIQNLDLDIVWNKNPSAHTGLVSKVEIQVTYEDNTIAAYAQLYNTTNSTIVDTVNTSSEGYVRVRSSALSGNWDTTNDDQYIVRIYTSNGANPAYLSNAKIIIDQSQSGGVTQLELAHQLVTTERSQTNSSYTQEAFTNLYDPGNFNTPHTRKIYFDTTIKTSGSAGYVQLYNLDDTDPIDTAANSEVTTTSTSYEQKLSADLGSNTDWPVAAKKLDTILKASASQTVYLSSSRILIEIANLDPSITLAISGIDSGQTHNNITTTVTSTVTAIPFNQLTPGTPGFAAQEIIVITNDSVGSYVVLASLDGLIQGLYPGNQIDPFIGSSATWTDPKTWEEPNGTVPNSDTGWFGANTTDTSLPGWSDGASKFGPFGTSDVTIVGSATGTSKTEYVTYGFEVNAAQPADQYAGTIVYTVVPVY